MDNPNPGKSISLHETTSERRNLLLDRDAVNWERLASQPTLSRFENCATARTLFRMAEALTDTVLRHQETASRKCAAHHRRCGRHRRAVLGRHGIAHRWS